MGGALCSGTGLGWSVDVSGLETWGRLKRDEVNDLLRTVWSLWLLLGSELLAEEEEVVMEDKDCLNGGVNPLITEPESDDPPPTL